MRPSASASARSRQRSSRIALRTITPTRYVAPLREGGSLPALVEADDDGLYVLKFRAAGQGPRALVAELVAGELARAIGLPVPDLAFAELDPRIGVAEPDPEIQELLTASKGLNVAMDFLPSALAFTPAHHVSPQLAADIVWFDALVMNVDRTPRNPNLLCWHDDLWLIDHGAAFFRHHTAGGSEWDASEVATMSFDQINQHVLLPQAGSITDAHKRLAHKVTRPVLDGLRDLVPADWAAGADYTDFLRSRLEGDAAWVQEAEHGRA